MVFQLAHLNFIIICKAPHISCGGKTWHYCGNYRKEGRDLCTDKWALFDWIQVWVNAIIAVKTEAFAACTIHALIHKAKLFHSFIYILSVHILFQLSLEYNICRVLCEFTTLIYIISDTPTQPYHLPRDFQSLLSPRGLLRVGWNRRVLRTQTVGEAFYMHPLHLV